MEGIYEDDYFLGSGREVDSIILLLLFPIKKLISRVVEIVSLDLRLRQLDTIHVPIFLLILHFFDFTQLAEWSV